MNESAKSHEQQCLKCLDILIPLSKSPMVGVHNIKGFSMWLYGLLLSGMLAKYNPSM